MTLLSTIFGIVQSTIFPLQGMITLPSKKRLVHKTDNAFQRYNLVTEEEMKAMKWLDLKQGTSGTMDTYYGHQSQNKDCISTYKLLI